MGEIKGMFEVGGHYANRKGNYTVLEINGPKMTVEYEDGSTAELNVNIQHRIWENIVAEEEIKNSRTLKTKKRRAKKGTKFFIRTVDTLAAEQLSIRAWKEHVDISEISKLMITKGDRLIYFAIESQTFFAVATITDIPKEPTARDHLTEKQVGEEILLFPVDVDARAMKVAGTVPIDTVEFESQPNIKRLLTDEDTYIAINEDEFELLAEILTEAAEEEDIEDDEEEDEDEFED